MNLYVIFKRGVYRHECGGVFDSLEGAERARVSLLEWEADSYHEYEIVPFILNEITQRGDYNGTLLERDALSTICKPNTNN